VNGVWESTNKTKDSFWMDELWLAGSVGQTTLKVGRMELDTPLIYTETWSIAKNTFESAVVINQDIPDTTLVGAYVGGSNGANENGGSGVIAPMDTQGTTNFSQFYNGAYAVGAINNSFKPVTAQAWYYEATGLGDAYWLQADLTMEGILAGVQYTDTQIATDSHALAIMVGYEIKDTVTTKLSYSKVGKGGDAGTNLSGSGATKLYTSGWLNSISSEADRTTYNLTIESPVNGIVDLGLYAVTSDTSTANTKKDEVTISASKSFGPLDTSVAYIYDNFDGSSDVNAIEAFLTYNF
jgi:hypothetical protein